MFMQTRTKKVIHVIAFILTVSLLLAGCSGSQSTAASGTGEAAAQAKPINWKMITSWSTGIPLYTDMAEYFAKEVERMSNGRLKIEVFPGGAIAPALEVTEAVKSGIADAGHLWPGYDIGKDATSALFGGFGGSGTSEEMLHWLYQGGGAELWRNWREILNLSPFPILAREQAG